ncbi:MAG: iron-containing alcohol dehydrogenase [Bacteroidales bacterium]|nr:iron-containing alcohol dehydrogenase [Bacteroidales bacterium]MDT8431716.1 iron-containing alcohol dehydrogenase [Bacteroidales bacterium]
MENFIAYNPTRLHFGKGVVNDLGIAAKALGNKALLVYGKGSVLRNGSYDDTVRQLQENNISVLEFNGIKPNPVVTDVDEAARLGIAEKVDMVVAVGGGSVIDSAKIIALCIADEVSGWDVMTGRHTPVSSKPLVAVLTLAATGTEMNPVAVLQNHDTEQKIGFRHKLMFPVHSFLDPTYTQSVPSDYTAYGIVDLVAHSLEAWFGAGQASLSDKFVISIIREAMEVGPELMNDLDNYDHRARIMWAATNALNDTTMHGRVSGDWGVHALGHTLSYLYDTAHGATLSVFYPAWMRRLAEKQSERIVMLGKALFNAMTAEETIAGFEAFFNTLGAPVRAQESGIPDDKKKEILALMKKNRASGIHVRLDEDDRKKIADLIFD